MSMLSLDHFVGARSAFRRRLTDDRAVRLGRPIKGMEFDDADGVDIRVDDPPAPPIAFHLVYQDARRQLSGRCVTLRNLKHEINEVRLTAICHMRNALRMFMASRIVEATDLSTGEVHEDGLAYFKQHPLLRQMSADDASTLSPEVAAVQECRDEIIVLSFVGAADGHFDEAEQDEVVRHVFNRWDEPLDERVVRQRLRSWVPDERAFDRALSRLCAGDGDARALMQSLRRVVDADGDFDREEMAFVDEIEGRLRSAGQI